MFSLWRIAPEVFDFIHRHLRLRQCVVYAPTQCSRIYPLNQQSGPLPVINGVITPISRVITPVTHLFSAIYRGSMGFCTKLYLVGAHFVGCLESPPSVRSMAPARTTANLLEAVKRNDVKTCRSSVFELFLLYPKNQLGPSYIEGFGCV